MVLARPRARSTIEINSKNSLYPHSYFTEHLVRVFEKSPRENDLNHESSSLLSGDSRIIPEHTPTAATLSSNPNAAHTNQTDVRNFVARKHQAVNTKSSERALDDVPPRDTSRNNLATEITQANRKWEPTAEDRTWCTFLRSRLC
jgi:hypothetical protein